MAGRSSAADHCGSGWWIPSAARVAVLVDSDNIVRVLLTASRLCRSARASGCSRTSRHSTVVHGRQPLENTASLPCSNLEGPPGRNQTYIALTVVPFISSRSILTSDADLAPLAHRMPMQGAQVHGVGSWHAAQAFQQACNGSVALPHLDAAIRERTPTSAITAHLWHHEPRGAEDHVPDALVRLGGARDWIEISRLSRELATSYGRFDLRAFSRRSLTALLEALVSVTADRTRGGFVLPCTAASRNGCRPVQGKSEVLGFP